MTHDLLPEKTYDAVIVGARAAGAATALLLARAGQRVLLIDRGRYGTDTLSTHALMRAGVLQLARWGLVEALESAGTPQVRSTSFHYGDDVVTVAIKPRGEVASLLAPRRFLLDRVLVDAATDAGADIRYGVSVQDVTRDDSGRVTGVLAHDENERPIVASARIVVGADGLHSKIAALVAAPVVEQAPHAAGVVYGYWPNLPVNGYQWYWADGVAVGAIPTNGGETCVFTALPATQFRRVFGGELRAGYRELMSRGAPRLASLAESSGTSPKLRGFAGHPGYLRRSHGPGWALVGDAGYFKDPLTAHGITDALRDAELLAAAVLDGSPGAFQQYQEVRDDLSRNMLHVTDRIASFDWDLSSIRELHHQLSDEMKREVEALQAIHLSGGSHEGLGRPARAAQPDAHERSRAKVL